MNSRYDQPRVHPFRKHRWIVGILSAIGLLALQSAVALAQPPPPPPPPPAPSPDDPATMKERSYPPPVVRRVPNVAGSYVSVSPKNEPLIIKQEGPEIHIAQIRQNGMFLFTGTFQNREFLNKKGERFHRACFYGDSGLLDFANQRKVTGVSALYPHASIPKTLVIESWEVRDSKFFSVGLVQIRKSDSEGRATDVDRPVETRVTEVIRRDPNAVARRPVNTTNLPGVDERRDATGFR